MHQAVEGTTINFKIINIMSQAALKFTNERKLREAQQKPKLHLHYSSSDRICIYIS